MARQRQSFVQRAMRKELRRLAYTNRSALMGSCAAGVAVCAVPLLIGSPLLTQDRAASLQQRLKRFAEARAAAAA